MVNQQKKRKSKNKAIEVIIVVFSSIALGVMILGLFILWITNPYDTKDKRQFKPIYKAAMKGVPGFRLTSVYINEKDDSVVFFQKSRKWEHSGSFSEKELEQIYRATKQLEAYLNENDWSRIHNGYKLVFKPVRQHQLNCIVTYVDGQAVFSEIFSKRTNDITDLHMMEDVHVITMKYFSVDVKDRDSIEQISGFANLKEIRFYMTESVDDECLTEFAKIMKKNNPKCKIFVGDEEFILPE